MASGDTLLVFSPAARQIPSSNYPTFGLRNNHLVLDFDDSVDKTCYFTGVMPANYAGGGVTVNLHYSMLSATSGNVVWAVAFERIGDEQHDIDSDGFASDQSTTDAVPGTSGKVGKASVNFSDGAQMDSVAAGELFRLRVSRDADNGSDTATNKARLQLVTIFEQ